MLQGNRKGAASAENAGFSRGRTAQSLEAIPCTLLIDTTPPMFKMTYK